MPFAGAGMPSRRGAIGCLLVLLTACASSPRSSAPAESRSPAPSAEAPAPAVEEEPAAPAPRRVTIGGAGDVLVHTKVALAAEQRGGFAHVFGELREVIGEDEIAFVNLETPLSLRVTPEGTGELPVLGASPAVAPALAAVGFDVASLANNHAYDQTARGLEETLAALAEASVSAIGAASTAEEAPGPVVIERDGVRVAFVAFTERLNRGPILRAHAAYVARFDPTRAEAALALARSRADVVVASIHWGHDFQVEPLAAHRALARRLVEQGADVILGHGPHVLHEVERLSSPRGEAVCAYSLGNLVSNQGARYRAGGRTPPDLNPAAALAESRDAVWLRARVVLEGERLRIDALEAVPLWTHNNRDAAIMGREPVDIRVRPLRSIEDEAIREERRPIIARTLGEAVVLVD